MKGSTIKYPYWSYTKKMTMFGILSGWCEFRQWPWFVGWVKEPIRPKEGEKWYFNFILCWQIQVVLPVTLQKTSPLSGRHVQGPHFALSAVCPLRNLLRAILWRGTAQATWAALRCRACCFGAASPSKCTPAVLQSCSETQSHGTLYSGQCCSSAPRGCVLALEQQQEVNMRATYTFCCSQAVELPQLTYNSAN